MNHSVPWNAWNYLPSWASEGELFSMEPVGAKQPAHPTFPKLITLSISWKVCILKLPLCKYKHILLSIFFWHLKPSLRVGIQVLQPHKRIDRCTLSVRSYPFIWIYLFYLHLLKAACQNSHKRQSNYRAWQPCLMRAPGPTISVDSTWARASSQGYTASRQDSLAIIGNLPQRRKPWLKTLVLQDGGFAMGR
jgi:hypothetical protein